MAEGTCPINSRPAILLRRSDPFGEASMKATVEIVEIVEIVESGELFGKISVLPG
jgi:hypothetical protein